MELAFLWHRGSRLVRGVPCLHPLRQGDLLPRHVAATRSSRRQRQGGALGRHQGRRFRRDAARGVGEAGGCNARLGQRLTFLSAVLWSPDASSVFISTNSSTGSPSSNVDTTSTFVTIRRGRIAPG